MRNTNLVIIGTFLAILLFASTALALEGEVYFGYFLEANYPARPYYTHGDAKFVSGVVLQHTLEDRFTPWIKLETLMNSYNGDGTFEPASIKYDVGITVEIYRGFYVDLSHMCWHPTDTRGFGSQRYTLIKAGYKF